MTYSPVTLESLLSHQNWALRMARRLVREESEAEDLVQRTWMAALRRPPQSAIGAKAWIRKVILNLARERHRRSQARVRHEPGPGTEPASEGGEAFESIARDEIHQLLSERLMQLAEPYRTVVLQRFYEDLTSVEIAQRLGIPAGTVRWRLKIGLDQLRGELDRRSHGDRSRWVSALLAFSPPSDPPPATAAEPTGPLVPGSVLLWGSLAASGLLGFLLLRGGDEPRAELRAAESSVVELDSARFETLAPGSAAQRTPLGAPSSGARPPADAVAPPAEGLAVLVVTEDGEPVPEAGIQVALAGRYELRTRTNAAGRAWLVPAASDLGAFGLEETRGRVSLRALAPGRALSELVHAAAPFTPDHEVRLTVGGPDQRLKGRVRSTRGEAVPDALIAWLVPHDPVELRPAGDFATSSYLTTTSDEHGAFELPNTAGRGGVVACFAPGFALRSQNFESFPASGIEIVLERGATIVGTVRHPDGSPAAGVSVTLESICKTEKWSTGLPGYDARRRGFFEGTRTDALGRYRIEAVSAQGRRRTLWAVHEESGHMATTTLRLEQDEQVLVWDADLDEHPRLELEVVDADGRPLSGLLAHVRRQHEGDWWTRRLLTDEAGRIRILDCPAETLFLDFFEPPGGTASLGWKRLAPSSEVQRVVLDSRRGIMLTGRVLSSSGVAETGGTLAAISLETSQETILARDGEGRFEQQLPPGWYCLVLRSEQSAGRLARFVARAGSRMDLGDLLLPELGSLRLEGSMDAAGNPSSYALYKIEDEGQPRESLMLAQDWVRDGVSLRMFPGRYRLILNPGSGAPPEEHVLEVHSSSETRFDLAAR
ncbi:MAG TPA: sigma-70 family RNA polymerase sigma factor [Planctomycetota bacterium]